MTLNPVERRMLELCEYWNAFRADPSKRLLVWQVPGAAARLLECFFAVQKHATPYTTGDLFITFDAPFVHSIQYSRALKEALAGQYAASRDDLAAEGVTPDWQFAPGDAPDTAGGFMAALRSFGSRHHQTIGHLVAVLSPTAVSDDRAFAAWVERALSPPPPERLRLAVIDPLEAGHLASLSAAPPALVQVQRPPIDALGTAQETFAHEPALGPAAVFRNYLMGLVTLVEQGSAAQVQGKAVDAIAFARRQGWADQEVAITLLVAGALLKEQRFAAAIGSYQQARHGALQTLAAGHPAGRQLVLQTWFGEAGVHLAAGEQTRAADCYDQAAVLAQQVPNPILAIEAFRMGAFCLARVGEPVAAAERSACALSIGERLTPEARAMTTLPIAALDWLRLLDAERVRGMEAIVHERDDELARAARDLEQQAAQLEPPATAATLRALEDDLACRQAAADARAALALEPLAQAGGDAFRQVFVRARGLFGPGWPLDCPVAIPQRPAVAPGDTQS